MKLISLFIIPACLALVPVQTKIKRSAKMTMFLNENNNDLQKSNNKFDTIAASVMTSAITLLLPLQDAMAKGGEYGLLEGKIGSTLHPFTMLALFLTSVYSGYLGLQWRRLRDVGEQLKQLSADIPKLSSGVTASFPLSATISKLQAESSSLSADTDASKLSSYKRDIEALKGLISLDATYSELVATRKDLVAQNLRDKHYATGSILLGVGVGVAILGAMNTYLRAGKLFPGPHLFAGAGIVGLWALSAALVPAMQKGNDTARSAHIALNSVNVLLFAWQVVTGWDIMLKVWEKTSWP